MRVCRCLVVAWVLAVLPVTGCVDNFDPASLIAGTRVLGARVEIDGDDTGRAWPAPGETFEARWLVAQPGTPQPLTSMFLACPAAPVRFGEPFCAGAPIPVSDCAMSDPEAPCLRVTVPDATALGDSSALLVLGGICAGGTPSFDLASRSFSCQGNNADPHGTPVVLTVPLERTAQTNHHPLIGAVHIDGRDWAEPDPTAVAQPPDGCSEGPRLPAVAPDQVVSLALAATPESFEPFLDSDGAMQVEELEVSHFATSRKLERQFSFATSAEPAIQVSWTAPARADVPLAGLFVRFFFVVRDGRGGTTWTRRALCVR